MFSLMPMRKPGLGTRELFRPAYPVNRLNREFETIFNRLFAGWPIPYEGLALPETKWGFDVDEMDKEFVIRAEAPGFDANDFGVFMTGNMLTLKAEHKPDAKEKKEGAWCWERNFEENVTLPTGIEPERIEAIYRNGILEVHVPKSEVVKPRRITVKT